MWGGRLPQKKTTAWRGNLPGGCVCLRLLGRTLPAARTRLSLVDRQDTAGPLSAVESVDDGLSLLRGNLHEAEAAAAARLPVSRHAGGLDLGVLGDCSLQILGRDRPGEVAEVECLDHLSPSLTSGVVGCLMWRGNTIPEQTTDAHRSPTGPTTI